MTYTDEVREMLEKRVAQRRQVEKILATNPDNRAELEGRLARMLDHEEDIRETLRKFEFHDKIAPLMEEAIAALGEKTTVEMAMKWHAARGNEFARACLAHLDSHESRQHSDEVEAAFAWHPAWHKKGEHMWHCDTPNDPDVWEVDKLLALYRRAHKRVPPGGSKSSQVGQGQYLDR